MSDVSTVTVIIDGHETEVPEGSTLLSACTAAGVDTPTICWAENLTPVNVCRVCVVEVEGSRALVPSCSRPAEDGMVVSTDSERVQHSRKMVLEFLASGTDLSEAPQIQEWNRFLRFSIQKLWRGFRGRRAVRLLCFISACSGPPTRSLQ